MTKYEALEFDTFSYNGDMDYIKESSVHHNMNKVYNYFEYKVNKVLESLEDRQNEFVDDEFYQNLIKDIENIIPKEQK